MMTQSPKEPFLPVLRELARTFQAFEQLSAQHIRQLGLTPPQFDVVATLGNTPGMTCKELSEKTLITKGTLTGVVDRLVDKGIVARAPLEHDRRSVFIALTRQGEAMFQQVFPEHIAHIKHAFKQFDASDLDRFQLDLKRMRLAFSTTLERHRNAL
jgi:DNA-binding MarR family transcriptional regulator